LFAPWTYRDFKHFNSSRLRSWSSIVILDRDLRSWTLGNATLVVAERSGWMRVLGASKPRPSAKGAHPYRKGHIWRPWGYLPPNSLSEGLVIHPEDTLSISRGSTGQMNRDGTVFHTCKECHKTESLWNHTATDRKEEEQLEDRRSVGASSCNCGDGTDQRVKYLMFMLMINSTRFTTIRFTTEYSRA